MDNEVIQKRCIFLLIRMTNLHNTLLENYIVNRKVSFQDAENLFYECEKYMHAWIKELKEETNDNP